MSTVQDWFVGEDYLQRELSFDSFMEAIQFINEVARLSEEMNHHPDLCIHDYRYVTVRLTTHDSGTITHLDINLANKINRLIM